MADIAVITGASRERGPRRSRVDAGAPGAVALGHVATADEVGLPAAPLVSDGMGRMTGARVDVSGRNRGRERASDRGAALVVGAGSGLGAALARRFAPIGMPVALAARRLEAVTALAGTIGPQVHPYACDASPGSEVDLRPDKERF